MKNAQRFASLVVILCLAVTSCAFASGDYANSMETIWANYAKGSASATSNEQLVNGTYRSFEMLYVIDSLLDDGSMTGQLDTIWSQYVASNSASESVIDQAANGVYRTFEAAYLMALAADTNGTYAKALNSVWSSYESGNASATSASQRLVNGSYRTFEAFYILAQLLDTQSTYSRNLKSIYSTYSSENKAAKSAAGQAANGFYRTFEVCYIVATLLDTQYLYAESLDSIWATYESLNETADSYIKKQVNGANRTFETLYIIAQLLSQDAVSYAYSAPAVIKPGNGEVLVAPEYVQTCPLQVTAPKGLNAYVYLRYRSTASGSTTSRERIAGASSPYEADIAFYVKAGKTVEIDVPVGKYKVYYALGGDFYGTEYLFGADTICYAVTDLANFYTDQWYANGNTYTLDGSEAKQINAGEFPVR